MKKNSLLLVVILFFNVMSWAQNDITIERKIDPNLLKNKDSAFGLVQSIYQQEASIKQDFGSWDAVLKSGVGNNELLDDRAIIIIYHPFDKSKKENKEQVKHYVLHREKEDWGTANWTNYLLNTKNVLIVIIDGMDNIINSTVKVNRAKSRLSQEISDAGIIVSQVTAFNMTDDPKVKVRFISLDKKQIKVPCSLEITNEIMKDKITIDIHELSRFSVHFGISASSLDKKNVGIDNQKLVITLDSVQKKEWKSNMILELVWNPIRQDVDRFDPIWKVGSSDQPLRRILSGIGIFGGLKVSKDPIQSIYLGVNYAITKELYVSAGYMWDNTITPSITDIGTVSSINDALSYAQRKYDRTVFFGLSFPPSAVINMLGLKKSEK